jgi:hypothetical protein
METFRIIIDIIDKIVDENVAIKQTHLVIFSLMQI